MSKSKNITNEYEVPFQLDVTKADEQLVKTKVNKLFNVFNGSLSDCLEIVISDTNKVIGHKENGDPIFGKKQKIIKLKDIMSSFMFGKKRTPSILQQFKILEAFERYKKLKDGEIKLQNVYPSATDNTDLPTSLTLVANVEGELINLFCTIDKFGKPKLHLKTKQNHN